MKNLPTYEECRRAIVDNEATCLHKFIYDNEPAGHKSEEEFRGQLLDVINELTEKGQA